MKLKSDDSLDFHLHTVNSDGDWTPEALIDHLISDGFALAAITDHDRVDTIAEVQALGTSKGLPIIAAIEMSTRWKGDAVDILCYGVDPNKPDLQAITLDLARRQRENIQMVYDYLYGKGYLGEHETAEFSAVLTIPSAKQPYALRNFCQTYAKLPEGLALGEAFVEAGFEMVTADTAQAVEVFQSNGAICILAHPGRGEHLKPFDLARLDDLRQTVPLDGLEAYYPVHSEEQKDMFLAYAQEHHLLVSSGSDSHRPKRLPIKYPAHLSQKLLNRLGIELI